MFSQGGCSGLTTTLKYIFLFRLFLCENTSSTYFLRALLLYTLVVYMCIPNTRGASKQQPSACTARLAPETRRNARFPTQHYSHLSSRQPRPRPTASGRRPPRARTHAARPKTRPPALAARVSLAVPSGEHGGGHGPGQQPGRHPARVRYSARVQREEHHREEGEGPRLG